MCVQPNDDKSLVSNSAGHLIINIDVFAVPFQRKLCDAAAAVAACYILYSWGLCELLRYSSIADKGRYICQHAPCQQRNI